MRINGFRCDTCGAEHLLTPLSMVSPDGAPFGWFVLKVAALLNIQSWMFCSKDCLTQWTTKPKPDCQTATAKFEYEGKIYAGVLHEVSE